jgi:hypothetical protein
MERVNANAPQPKGDVMNGIAGLARQIMSSRTVQALMALSYVALTLYLTRAHILINATGAGDFKKKGGSGNQEGFEQLITTSQALVDKALPLTIIVAPLVFVGGALMMQFGGPTGAKRASTVMYGAVGASVAVVAAKGLMA